MTKSDNPAVTHKVRPKTGKAEWEHVTDAQLAQMRQTFGERTFRASYEVQELATKPEALETTKPPKGSAIEDPNKPTT